MGVTAWLAPAPPDRRPALPVAGGSPRQTRDRAPGACPAHGGDGGHAPPRLPLGAPPGGSRPQGPARVCGGPSTGDAVAGRPARPPRVARASAARGSRAGGGLRAQSCLGAPPRRPCVWLSGRCGAVAPGVAAGKTAWGMAPSEVRKYGGGHRPRRLTRLAHFFCDMCRCRWGKQPRP